MLARLRLDGFVGRNHQEQHVDSRRAREHVAHKALVPRDIHKTEAHAVLFEEREAEINGDAAALLFFEPVGMGACQCFDQRGLAVVNVPCSADDDALRCCGLRCSGHGCE